MFRRRNAKEPRNVCKSKMVEEVVAVQRLVLLEPAPRTPEGVSTATGPNTRSKARAASSPSVSESSSSASLVQQL